MIPCFSKRSSSIQNIITFVVIFNTTTKGHNIKAYKKQNKFDSMIIGQREQNCTKITIIMIPQQLQFEEKSLQIINGKETEEVSLKIRQLTQWGGAQLRLCFNKRATILKEIAHIHFLNLRDIMLSGNSIQSVEGMCRVHMHHIMHLFLSNNSITSVRGIRKGIWFSLQTLDIGNNLFCDASTLTQGCFSQLISFTLYWTFEENKFDERSFPGKMQTYQLQWLQIKAKKFCYPRCIRATLQKRWNAEIQ